MEDETVFFSMRHFLVLCDDIHPDLRAKLMRLLNEAIVRHNQFNEALRNLHDIFPPPLDVPGHPEWKPFDLAPAVEYLANSGCESWTYPNLLQRLFTASGVLQALVLETNRSKPQ